VADVDSVVGELVARVSGFGPLQPFLDDPTVEEIRIGRHLPAYEASR
jgi:pilus assembly protein CpaF